MNLFQRDRGVVNAEAVPGLDTSLFVSTTDRNAFATNLDSFIAASKPSSAHPVSADEARKIKDLIAQCNGGLGQAFQLMGKYGSAVSLAGLGSAGLGIKKLFQSEKGRAESELMSILLSEAKAGAEEIGRSLALIEKHLPDYERRLADGNFDPVNGIRQLSAVSAELIKVANAEKRAKIGGEVMSLNGLPSKVEEALNFLSTAYFFAPNTLSRLYVKLGGFLAGPKGRLIAGRDISAAELIKRAAALNPALGAEVRQNLREA